MRKKRLRWAWTLPVVELLLAAIIAGAPAARLLYALHEHVWTSTKGAAAPKELVNQINILLSTTKRNYPDRYEAIAYLNLPGMFPQLLIDRFTSSWPEEWMPHWSEFLGMWGWRSLLWPILCLPFWWLSGRGIDAFIASISGDHTRKIRWFEAWGVAAFGLSILIFGAGLAITSGPGDEFPEMAWLLIPTAMWFVFGLISLLAWFRQRRSFPSRPETSLTTQ